MEGCCDLPGKKYSMNIYSIYGVIFRLWRERRWRQFLATIRPSPTDLVLDVGGYPWFWTQHELVVQRIDTLNPHVPDWKPSETLEHPIRVMTGDGRHMPQIADRSYNIAFSNSVIEHVGSWEDQKSFAKEMVRVGEKLWVQTPAFECPIEPHFLLPFVHWFPRRVRKSLVYWLSPASWIQKWSRAQSDALVDEIRLITKNEMQALFPACSILTERLLLFFPKSYIAVRLTGPTASQSGGEHCVK